MPSFAFPSSLCAQVLALLCLTASVSFGEDEFVQPTANQHTVSVAMAGNESDETGSQRIDSERKQPQAVSRTYQLTSLVIMALAISLAAVLYVSRQRLRNINKQLHHEIESNRKSQLLQEKLAKRVTQAERMESLGALAGGVAHDFNNLLVGVINNAQLTIQDPENYEKYIPGILEASKTASELAQQMLAYAGRQKMSKKALEVNEVVGPLVSMITKNSGQHTVRFHPSIEPAWAMADKTQVGQIVLNLVSNATAASTTSAAIDVSIDFETVTTPDPDPQFAETSNSTGEFVVIKVCDNGEGIANDEIERIFDPFHSSATTTGRGLGLAVVYGLVKQHQGLIRVTSEVQKGTCFQVLLPQTTAVEPEPEPRALPPTAVESGFLVLVDDEELIRRSSRILLESIGWSVLTFPGGKELLDFIRDGSNPMPDCILMDIVMPEMAGYEVIERLDDLGNTTPILIMSGYSTPELSKYLALDNVKALLAKPFELDVLQEAVVKATGKEPV